MNDPNLKLEYEMAKPFSTLKNAMRVSSQKAIEDKTKQLMKEWLIYEILLMHFGLYFYR